MVQTLISPELFLFLSLIYYTVYEHIVMNRLKKEKEEELVKSYSPSMQDFYHSTFGQFVRFLIYSVNILIAFVLLLFLFQNFIIGIIFFILYQSYFYYKLKRDRLVDMLLLYYMYHVPFYLVVILTLLLGG